MLWNMIVEAQTEEQLTASITVEAPTWYGALREGLEKHHIDGAVLSTLSCRVQTDGTVRVSDAVFNREFTLRPVECASEAEERAADPDAALVAHEVFLMRDRHPSDEEGVCYRERHIAAEAKISKEDASHLVHHYFNMLKAEGTPEGCKCFISVHLYDHIFKERSERPPVAALTWREWMPEKPKLLFPLSGDEGTTFSLIPAADESIPLSENAADKEHRAPKPVETTGSRFGVGERMIAAFEGVQDIYGIHNHEEAAAFVLSLARDLVRSGGGSCMLISPEEYVLYVAAAEGDIATPHLKKSISSRNGIIGFALKNSAVINVSDAVGDARFDGTFDGREGFRPRSVLCAPMQYEGQVIGVLELVDSVRPDGFVEEEVNVLSYLGTSFAEYAALSLPSRHAEFTERDFAEEKKASSRPPAATSIAKKPVVEKKAETKKAETKPAEKKTHAKKKSAKSKKKKR